MLPVASISQAMVLYFLSCSVTERFWVKEGDGWFGGPGYYNKKKIGFSYVVTCGEN